MTNFPIISMGRKAMYPLSRSTNWKTQVLQYTNDTEQRWVKFLPKQEFELVFTDIDGASLSIIREFWQSMKGVDLTSFTLDLGRGPHGETGVYNNLAFTEDDFKITSTKANRWSITLKVRQLS